MPWSGFRHDFLMTGCFFKIFDNMRKNMRKKQAKMAGLIDRLYVRIKTSFMSGLIDCLMRGLIDGF